MTAGRDAYTHAVAALKRGEVLGVFPEAGVSASFTVRELKTGADGWRLPPVSRSFR